MNQRNALLISAVLTAFVLVVLGGLAAIVLQPSALAAPETSAAPAAAPPAQTLDPNREAAYQQALADAQAQLVEANRRLEQANAELAATTIPPSPPPPVPTDPPAAPTYAISADVAGQIALLVAPGATLQAVPDLVLYEGTAAYEVVLDQGRVYVDATAGRVLYNSARAPQAQAPAPPAGRAYAPQENDEHAGGGDD
jgi:uncharacterized membrane protein YkoI